METSRGVCQGRATGTGRGYEKGFLFQFSITDCVGTKFHGKLEQKIRALSLPTHAKESCTRETHP